MRGATLAAVLSCAAQALALGAVTTALAQVSDAPPLSQQLTPPSLEPSIKLPPPTPEVQQTPAAPLAAPSTPPEAPPAAPDAAQPGSAGEPPLAQGTAPAPQADPVVAIIRAKLADPAIGKDANADDLAALAAFYGASGRTVMDHRDGLLGQGATGAVRDRDRPAIGGSTPRPSICRRRASCRRSVEAQALAEIKLDLAILKYARYARGGRFTPVDDQRAVRSDAAVARSEHGPRRDRGGGGARRLSSSRSIPSTSSSRSCARRCSRRSGASGEEPSPPDKDIKRLIINMERWRWMPEDLGSLYVWNNSPEFMLYVVKDGKAIFGDKTLVGTIGYATPVFTSPHDHHRVQSGLGTRPRRW